MKDRRDRGQTIWFEPRGVWNGFDKKQGFREQRFLAECCGSSTAGAVAADANGNRHEHGQLWCPAAVWRL